MNNELDLEELWQTVRCRFRHRRNFWGRVRLALYKVIYRFTRHMFEAGARW